MIWRATTTTLKKVEYVAALHFRPIPTTVPAFGDVKAGRIDFHGYHV